MERSVNHSYAAGWERASLDRDGEQGIDKEECLITSDSYLYPNRTS